MLKRLTIKVVISVLKRLTIKVVISLLIKTLIAQNFDSVSETI